MFGTVDLMQYHRNTPGAIKTAESKGLDGIWNMVHYMHHFYIILLTSIIRTFPSNDLISLSIDLRIVYEKFNDSIS